MADFLSTVLRSYKTKVRRNKLFTEFLVQKEKALVNAFDETTINLKFFDEKFTDFSRVYGIS